MATSVTQCLRDNHKKIRGLFRQAQVLVDRAQEMERGICDELMSELSAHQSQEIELLYPFLLEQLLPPEERALIPQAMDDYREISEHTRLVQTLGVRHEEFPRAMGELRRVAQTHFEWEEREIFPLVERICEGQGGCTSLMEGISSLRASALPAGRAGDPSFVQNPKGGEQKRKAG